MERDHSMSLSRSGSLRSSSRTTLIRRNQSMSAKQIRFYRNGDRFFSGLKLAVSPERYKEIDALLAELSNKLDLSSGAVRFIFNGEDGSMITDISQLHYGVPYVCSSSNTFKQLEVGYGKTATQWALAQKNSRSINTLTGIENLVVSKETSSGGGGGGTTRDFIKPKLVTVIRNGKPPQKKVTLLLNNKTAISLDQVLDHLSAKGALGKVDKLYSVDRKLVKDLRDLFDDDTVFIAFSSNEKFPEEGVELDPNTYRITPYRELKRPSNLKRSNSLRTPRKYRDENENLNGRSNKPPRPKSMGPGIKMQVSTKSPRPKSSSGKKMNGDIGKEELYPTAVFERESSDSGSEFEFETEIIKMYSKREKLSIHGFYKIGKIIGDGNFAVVRQCKNRQTGKEFALKVINKAKVKGKEHMIENEILILRRVKHPHIVELIEEFETPKEIFLIMELVSGGDLFDAIVQATRFTERDASHMIRDLASAVDHLHDLHVVHRDIKPENLLVVHRPSGTMSLKLADFGLSIEVKSPMFLVCGTPTYVAPEILDESGYGLKVDLWAIGVISYILLCGFPPFRSENNDQEELFDKIMRGDYEYLSPFWDDISSSAKDLINHMLVVEVEKRFTANQVLEHPWIKGHTALSKNIQRKLSSELTKNFHHRKRLRGVAMAIQTVIALLKYVRQKRNLAALGANSSNLGSFSAPLSPKRTLALVSKIPRVKPTTPRHHIEEIRKCMTAHIRKYNTYSLCSTKSVSTSVSRANSGEYEIAETGRYSVIGNVYRRVLREGGLNGQGKRPILDVQLGRQTVSSQKMAKKNKPIVHKHSCSAHYLSYYETPAMVVGETTKHQAKPRRQPSQKQATSVTPGSSKPKEERRPFLTGTPRSATQKSSLAVKGPKPSYIPIRSAPSSPRKITPRKSNANPPNYGSVSLPNTPGVGPILMATNFTYSPANSCTSVRSTGSTKSTGRKRIDSDIKRPFNQVRSRVASDSQTRRASVSSTGGINRNLSYVISQHERASATKNYKQKSDFLKENNKCSKTSLQSQKKTPYETPRKSGIESQRKPSFGSQPKLPIGSHVKSCVDLHRKPSADSHHKPTADSNRKSSLASHRNPSIDTHRKPSAEQQRKTLIDSQRKQSNGKSNRPTTLDLNGSVKGRRSNASNTSKCSNQCCKVDSKDIKTNSKPTKNNDGNISITTKTSKTENIKISLGKTVNKMVETETSTTVSVIIEKDAKIKQAEDSRVETKEPSLGQTLLSKVKRLAEEIESLAKFDNVDEKPGERVDTVSTPTTGEDSKPDLSAPVHDSDLPPPACVVSSTTKEEKPTSQPKPSSSASACKDFSELSSSDEIVSCPEPCGTLKQASVSSHLKSFEEEELDLNGIDDIVYRNVRDTETLQSTPECNQDIFGPTEYLSLSSKQTNKK